MDSGSAANQRHFRWIRRGFSFSGNERNSVFLNTHDGRFADVSAVSGLDFHDDARAVGRVDWDLDGDVDFWIANRNGPQVRFARNDSPSENHFVAVRLEGTTCNRDAIGARIELTLDGTSPATQLRTLHAGDGYLAQSSKWIHFGLGKATEVTRLAVHWPDGDTEVFSGAAADGFYRLVQGAGKCEELNRSRRTLNLTPSKLSQPAASDRIQVILASPIPFPRSSYRTWEGNVADISKRSRPLLVNLWASWCQPCLVELSEFGREKERLEEHIDVLALSVDGLGDDRGSERDARDLIAKLDLPLTFGWATDDLIDKVHLVHHTLFASLKQMPIPSSLLLNSRGELAAIYEGPVSAARVLDDLRRTSADADSVRLDSLPAKGRWAEHRQPIRLLPMAWDMIKNGWLDDGLEYIQRNQQSFQRDAEYGKLLALAGYELLERGDTQRAIDQYRAALKVDPTYVVAHLNLAAALVRSRDYAAAISQYRAAIRQEPNDVRIQYSLAWLLATIPDPDLRDGEEAVLWAQKAAEATGFRRTIVLETLAASLAEAGRYDEAVAMANKVLELARHSDDRKTIERTEKRMRLYQAGQPYHED